MNYKYNLKLLWDNNDKQIDIDSNNVKTFFIKSDYENSTIPMIILNLYLNNDLCDNIILNKNTGRFIFTLEKFKDNINYILNESYIKLQCIYVILDDINYNKINSEFEKDNDNYRTINIGLIRYDLIEQNICNINTVVSGQLIEILLGYTKLNNLLIEPIHKEYDGIIPPISKVSQLISFLNDTIGSIYSTPYRFFIDHNRTYLISSSGNSIYGDGDKEFSVYINILSPLDNRIRNDGFEFDSSTNICNIFVDSRKTKCYLNNTNKLTCNNIMVIDENGCINSKLSNSNIKSTEYIFDRTELLSDYEYIKKINDFVIVISLLDCDNSIFTINREYIINNVDRYNKYNGKYLLCSKIEGFTKSGDSFKSNISLVFKKIPRE